MAANGLLALQGMANASNECALDVARQGGISIAIQNLVAYKTNEKIVVNGLRLLNTLTAAPMNVAAILKASATCLSIKQK